MLNYKLKTFLKYLRNNKIIEEYEFLFDKIFDFNKLLDLSGESISRICKSLNSAAIVLYEEVNGINIPDNIFNYIIGLKSKELQKYAVRMATSKYNSEESLKYIITVCEGASISSSKYAYSIAMSDKLDENENKCEYIRLVANSDENTSVQMRDLILTNRFLDDSDNLSLLRYLSGENEYIAKYMIKLYNDTHSFKYLHLLSYAIGEVQAAYTYEILKNKELMDEYNGTAIALTVTGSEADDAYSIISLIRKGDYYNLDEKIELILKKDIKDIDIDELFKSRNLDTIISGLSHISDESDIKIKTKN